MSAGVPAFQENLDPLLLQPVRLFILCLLADCRWCEDVAVRGALRQTTEKITPHVELMHAAGYLEAHTQGQRTKIRLTPLGLDRLTDHVDALHAVTNTAAELIAAQRTALRPVPSGDADA